MLNTEFLKMVRGDTNHGRNVDAESAGLRNIRSRVDFLRGNLEIESRAGKGTFFAIHLPIGIVEPVEV